MTAPSAPTGDAVLAIEGLKVAFRTPDGAVERALDLKTINRGLEPTDAGIRGLFRLRLAAATLVLGALVWGFLNPADTRFLPFGMA